MIIFVNISLGISTHYPVLTIVRKNIVKNSFKFKIACIIKAKLSATNSESVSKGKVVLATVHGDIHDIGKNIVKVLLDSYGFTVIDLGKDVPPETIVNAAIENKVSLVGLSALMTTTLGAMAETIKQLNEKYPECKTVVGGAVLTASYAEQIHADFYAKDAKQTVDIASHVYNA